jgi:hypothetical protein
VPPKIEYKPEDIKSFWEVYDNRAENGLDMVHVCASQGWKYYNVKHTDWYRAGVAERRGRGKEEEEALNLTDLQIMASDWLRDMENGMPGPKKEAIQLLLGHMNNLAKTGDRKKIPPIETKGKGILKCSKCGEEIILGG